MAEFGEERETILGWKDALGVGVASIAVTVGYVALFGVTGMDDPYMTFQSAQVLLDTGQLNNINGEAIEGSTTLLLVLILAFLGWLTPWSIPMLGWMVGLVATAGVLGLGWCVVRRETGLRWPAWSALAMLALLPPFAYWASSGSETSLSVLLLLGSLYVYSRAVDGGRRWWSIIVLSLLVLATFLARPDLGLAVGFVVVAMTAGRAIARRSIDRFEVVLAGTSLLAIGSVFLFRFVVFGQMVPQPVEAKAVDNIVNSSLKGLAYVRVVAFQPWSIILVVALTVALVAVGLSRSSTFQLSMMLSLVVILGQIVYVGGDWMPFGRFMIAPSVLAVVALAIGLSALLKLESGQGIRRASSVVAALLALIFIFEAYEMEVTAFSPASTGSSVGGRWVPQIIPNGPRYEPANSKFNEWNSAHLRDDYFLGQLVPVVEELLRTREVVHIASPQAGMVPYYLYERFGSRVDFTDRAELITDRFGDCEDAKRTPFGRFTSLQDWISGSSNCGPPLPDIYYDTGITKQKQIEQEFVILGGIDGYMTRAGRSGKSFAKEWYAVRRDLLPLISEGPS